MGTVLVLPGSMNFGGAFLMIALDANSAARETLDKYAGDLHVQGALTEVASCVESEFRNEEYLYPGRRHSI